MCFFVIINSIFKFLLKKSEKILSCVESGAVKLWSLKTPTTPTPRSPLVELNAGANLTCLRKSKFNSDSSSSPFLFATGGKDNDLKVWDLNDGGEAEKEVSEPMFRAKNMPDNWMQLREPVWIMSMDFMDERRVVVGTAHHQVDIKIFSTSPTPFLPLFLIHSFFFFYSKLKMYDIKSGIRKPVLNMSYGENPITSLVCLPDGSK